MKVCQGLENLNNPQNMEGYRIHRIPKHTGLVLPSKKDGMYLFFKDLTTQEVYVYDAKPGKRKIEQSILAEQGWQDIGFFFKSKDFQSDADKNRFLVDPTECGFFITEEGIFTINEHGDHQIVYDYFSGTNEQYSEVRRRIVSMEG
ncbi:hypothetical protein COB57_02020 [Candidatus Peregrinibacteria bacterium]|nr:MAG: hypothetical protein COB57_02020 [Candidatus Peregrinibacteria bacterium]